MPDHTKDIDGLLGYLSGAADHSFTTIPSNIAADYYAALTALVAERDALKQRVAELEAKPDPLESIGLVVMERNALLERVAELEAHPPADRDRELRERLICAADTATSERNTQHPTPTKEQNHDNESSGSGIRGGACA